jgi:hypothetical protein
MPDPADTTDRPAYTPISHAEQIRWQRDAAGVLGKLLELAAKRGLPVISWTVGSSGAQLHGQCVAHPMGQRRADFEAWRDALGEPDSDRELDHTPSADEIRLIAVWERGGSAGRGRRPLLSDRDGYQRAGVVLTASIWPDDEDQDEAAGR